jgi:hypothetical protein
MAKAEEYRQAAIVFILMILVFFWPLFRGKILSQADTLYSFPPWNSVKPSGWAAPSNSVLNDQTREFLTFFQVAKESLQRMEFPLWNPYIMAGTPLLANSQSALLFPLNWPFYILPLFVGFTVSALLKMFIASFGTYLFARKLSLSHLAAILAGTIYTFSIFNIFWLNHPHANVTIFFPWLLLLAENVIEDPTRPTTALLGLVVGVQLLGGHVELAFHVAFAVTLFFLFRLFDYRKDWKGLFLRLKIFVGGYTLGFFLAGILMIPFLEFLSQSATWRVRSGENIFFAQPIGFISMFLPDFFTGRAWSPDLIGYHAVSLYVGICPLILAIVVIVSRPRRILAFFAVLCLFGLDVVFGLPPFFPLLGALPLFKQAPNYYMVIFYVLGMSLLGAAGMDLVLTLTGDGGLRRKIRRNMIMASLIMPVFVIGLIFISMKAPPLSDVLKGLEGSSTSPWSFIFSQIREDLIRSLFLAGLGCLMVTDVFRIRRFKWLLGILVIGWTFVDLFIAGSGWNPMIPKRWAQHPLPPAVQFLDRDRQTYRIAGIEPVMPPNLATLCGLQDIRGYDVPVERRYHLFFQKALKGKTAWWIYEFPKLEMEAMPFLSLLNVKYVLSLSPLPPPLLLVYDKEIKIYKNPESFSRAFLVHQVETVANGPEALERVMALGPELKHVAVLETPPGSLSNMSAMGKGEGTGDRVRIMAYTARQVEIEVETSSPGLLVLGDTYFPGWKVEIDGKGASVFRANYLLRGIAVDSGRHRVKFFYRPVSFYIGFGFTIIAGVMTLWCLKRKKRRTEEK